MGKQLLLQGFTITPIVHAVDIDAATIEPFGVNPVHVGPADVIKWATETWPGNWDLLCGDYAASIKSAEQAEANEAAAQKRAARKKKPAAE